MEKAEKHIKDVLGSDLKIIKSEPIVGGSINAACKLTTSKGIFFLKQNIPGAFPQMFSKEASSLHVLRSKSNFHIPDVIAFKDDGETAFLLLEFIETRIRKKDFFRVFGRNLAELHLNSNEKFGWEEGNYIGSLHQRNEWKKSWTEFFISERITQQLELAKAKSMLTSEDLKAFDRLFGKWDELIPKEKPSLIHGDLWSGNYLTDCNGFATIIDPAIYYGHREMDLAMSKLFGGFDSTFYSGYHEQFPLEPGWEERIDLHNLYPLLVHLNLFGSGYSSQIRTILRRFT